MLAIIMMVIAGILTLRFVLGLLVAAVEDTNYYDDPQDRKRREEYVANLEARVAERRRQREEHEQAQERQKELRKRLDAARAKLPATSIHCFMEEPADKLDEEIQKKAEKEFNYG